ncbi:hypothetical protein KKE92_04505 [Candidatus Micrarchaeota archaeon]|nr:hypothetical protein [Candidatus Micrarchaeota archaeon]MBU1681925.1 hypothetical protein [Candidatus Micrarchaeota archaeon]
MDKQQVTVTDVLKTTQVALDNYDDIFSDFDYSDYSKRLLSSDFLKELQRRYEERKKGEYEVTFTLPKNQRNAKTESLIKKRIKNHFKENLTKIDKTIQQNQLSGLVKVVVGFLISIFLFTFSLQDIVPTITLLSVLSWYFLWAGYTDIFESAQKLRGKREFFENFHKAKFSFVDEESLLMPKTLSQGSS